MWLSFVIILVCLQLVAWFFFGLTCGVYVYLVVYCFVYIWFCKSFGIYKLYAITLFTNSYKQQTKRNETNTKKNNNNSLHTLQMFVHSRFSYVSLVCVMFQLLCIRFRILNSNRNFVFAPYGTVFNFFY